MEVSIRVGNRYGCFKSLGAGEFGKVMVLYALSRFYEAYQNL